MKMKKIFNKNNINVDSLYSISELLIVEVRRIFNHNYCDYDIDDMKEEIFTDSIYYNTPINLFNLFRLNDNNFYISGMRMSNRPYIPFKKDKKESIKDIST